MCIRDRHSGHHNTIAADVPQGSLVVRSLGASQFANMKYSVRKSGDSKTLNYQTLGESEKYLVGKYDLEIPVLPILNISNVEIKQSTTTTVDVPRPGIVNLQSNSPGYGSIYIIRDKKQELIYNAKMTNAMNESVALLPGSYMVVFRALYANRSLYTTYQKFEIQSGVTVSVKLN